MSPDKLINNNSKDKINEFEFPQDLAKKGKEMMDCYYNLFILENFLRIFIEKIAQNKYGVDYWDKITINRKMQDEIDSRKKEEKKHNWISLRKDSNLFYTDFLNLKTIISSNWKNLFKNYFPKETWITQRLEDLYNLRNRVAHNNYIERVDQDNLKSIANTIYSKLAPTLKYEYPKDFIIKEEKHISNRFSEFQSLIYTKNYKRIFDQWNKFKILFINPIFSISDHFSQYRGFIYLNYKLVNKTLKLEYEGSDFSCLIEYENKRTIENKNNSFFNEAKQFFEDIKDSVDN